MEEFWRGSKRFFVALNGVWRRSGMVWREFLPPETEAYGGLYHLGGFWKVSGERSSINNITSAIYEILPFKPFIQRPKSNLAGHWNKNQ